MQKLDYIVKHYTYTLSTNIHVQILHIHVDLYQKNINNKCWDHNTIYIVLLHKLTFILHIKRPHLFMHFTDLLV